MPESRAWEIWVDIGGTFTDCMARGPDDRYRRAKVLSSSALRATVLDAPAPNRLQVEQNWSACDDLIVGNRLRPLHSNGDAGIVISFDAVESVIELNQRHWQPRRGDRIEVLSDEPAPILAARLVTGTPANRSLPAIHMRLATTRGTNALLERRGAAIALFITEGFGDLLEIGDQQRPDLFALHVVKAPPLYKRAIEVRERLDASGRILQPIDLPHLRALAEELVRSGIRVAAVALMHSAINPAHEQAAARTLREAGFEHVSCSSELAPLIRLLPRAETAMVNAYLAPAIEEYLMQVQGALPADSKLHVMTSAGGLVQAASFRPCDSLLSGPAGGIAGVAACGAKSGMKRLIGFDMGGTSTDVVRFDGAYEYRFEQKIAGVRLMSPALAIETVAAGGGSICSFANDRMTVGPQSAGALPGPACYGAGGPLTLTDVNLLLNRIDSSRFEIPVELEPAHAALKGLQDSLPERRGAELICQGFLDIANERMASAIESISVRLGYNPREYTLVAFGGAGGQHGCAVADKLGIRTVLMPADASMLSALGLGHASIERIAQRQIFRTLDECSADLQDIIAALAQDAMDQVRQEGVEPAEIQVRRAIVQMRLLGQDSALMIEQPNSLSERDLESGLRAEFRARYSAMYGHEPAREGATDYKPIEIESVRVIASSNAAREAETLQADVAFEGVASTRSRIWFDTEWLDVEVFDRRSLQPGHVIVGPAMVCGRRTTCVVERNWTAEVDSAGALVVRRGGAPALAHGQIEVAELELFTNRFAAIADDMGQMLQRTALSTNVKERLDFSCGLLDAAGELVVNAPHIPVHLGALGICVRSVRQRLELRPGDVAVTNHPAFGGSHLPDLTVITPVFDDQQMLLGFVASRAHHAEIGGTRPGSMPPTAATLAEEGVVIEPALLIAKGVSQFHKVEEMLRSGRFPSRAVGDNVADLRAMVAANHRGAEALHRMASAWGSMTVHRQMSKLAQRAETLMGAALQRLPERTYSAAERLDDGSAVQVAIQISHGRAIIDFAGTADVHPGNLNATPAIVRSAVMYVLRMLVGENLPLNEGIMRCIDLRIPQGMLNPAFDDSPSRCPAVVGGNTETSQRVVDALIKALQLGGCSQGTMNNVLFGNDRFGYYETICGGCGAVDGFHGASAVHSHMTNTRITDPEVIEHRYPVRVEQFSIRRGSGGSGRFRGGDGAIRAMTFLQPLSLSVLTQHRTVQPYGMSGGGPGLSGRQHVIRASGEVIELASIDGCEVRAGDRFIIETPGGGGYG